MTDVTEPTVHPVVVPTVAVELPGGRSLFACRYEEPTTGRELVAALDALPEPEALP